MHGQKRLPKDVKHDKARLEAKRKKAGLYAQLSQKVFERRRDKRYDEESLALAGKILEMNCELYSLWNYRKEYLQPRLRDGSSASGDSEGPRPSHEAAEPEGKAALVQQELRLIEAALQKNPKSYATWQHRKWLVALCHEIHRREQQREAPGGTVAPLCDLQNELALCTLLLSLDERNFHCWSYRRFVVRLSRADLDSELAFTTDKILQNFSNYSAWHYRSALLPEVNKVVSLEALMAGDNGADDGNGDGGGGGGGGATMAPPPAWRSTKRGAQGVRLPLGVLDEELKLVKEAFYTEPEDQSAWLYHAWLMSQLVGGDCDGRHGHGSGSGAAAFGEEDVDSRLAEEVRSCEEILEIEPEAKWPMLTLARLLEMQAGRPKVKAQSSGGQLAAQLKGRASGLYEKLTDLDYMRAGYYKDAAAALLS
mmetsp:Transcript_10169/g.20685  ORF Transcript_10169/g.20685 Transcript_10169/m.20685 type:complete len:424 (+) Transcript_10169:183-1454(+)